MFTRKKILAALGLVGGLTLVCLVSPFKETLITKVAATSPFPGQDINDLIIKSSMLAGFLLGMTYKLVHILEVLVDPRTFIDIAYIGPALHNIWAISRNVVNVCLAILLLAGGVVLVVLPDKKSAMLTLVPKFILAMVLVNFSWFFPRIILDVSHVLTATVYTIPAAVSNTGITCETKDEFGNPQPCKIWKGVKFGVTQEEKASLPPGYTCYNEGSGDMICYQKVPLSDAANSPGSIFSGLIFNHANIASLTMYKSPTILTNNSPSSGAGTSQTEKEMMVLMNIGFALVLIMMLATPLIAMAAAFILRIPILWLTIAFMPFIFIGFLIGDRIPESMNPKKIWSHFLAAAFLPFAVSIPLSAGFILLNGAVEIFNNATLLPSTAFGVLQDEQNLSIPGQRTILDLLWLIMTFMVLWMGTFAALKVGVFAKVVEPIQRASKTLAKLPLAVPWIPIPGGGKQSLASIAGAPRMVETARRSAIVSQQRGLSQRLNTAFGNESQQGTGGNTQWNGPPMSDAAFRDHVRREYTNRTDNTFKQNIDSNVVQNFSGIDDTDCDANFIAKIGRQEHDTPQLQTFNTGMDNLRTAIRNIDNGPMDINRAKAVLSEAGETIVTGSNREKAMEEWILKNGG